MSTIHHLATGLPPTPVDAAPVQPAGDPLTWDPLVVEIEIRDAQGVFYTPDWIAPDVTVEWTANKLMTATLRVIPHAGWLVNDGTPETPAELAIEDLLRDDQRVRIRTARPNPEQDLWLCEGYVARIERGADERGRTISLALEDVAVRLAETLEHHPCGQPWLRKSDLAAPAQATAPVIVSSLPRIYNPDGAGNSRRGTLSLAEDINTLPPDTPAVFEPAVFTYALDPEAQQWTWARVFIDLFWQLRRRSDGTLGPWPWYGRDLNLWTKIFDHDWHQFQPQPGDGPQSDPWAAALLGVPRSHSVEGLNWMEALTHTCAKCGLGWRRVVQPDHSTGGVVHGIEFFAPGAARRLTLQMPSGAMSTSDKPWYDVRARADVKAARVSSDYRAIVNDVQVRGKAGRYEVAIELRPGWAYDALRDPQVDFDPTHTAEIEQAIELHLRQGNDGWDASEEFKRAYARGPEGTQQYEDDNWVVLRRWIAPDLGDELHLARPFAPWVADQYLALELRTLGLTEFSSDGRHAVRPRPIKAPLSGATRGDPFQPLVQVSYDSGASWVDCMLSASVMHKRCGLFFTAPSLWGADSVEELSDLTFAEAYLYGLLRVRVIGTIDGDQAAGDGWRATSDVSLSRRRRGRTFVEPDDLQIALRDDRGNYGGGNSPFKGDSSKPATGERWDDELGRLLMHLERRDRLRHAGTLALPGIILPLERLDEELGTVREGLWPGDEIEALVAQDGQHQHDLRLPSRNDERYTMISGVSWTYSPGGQGQAAHATTTLTIEDPLSLMSLGKQ